MLPGDSHGPNGPRNDRKIEICTDHCVIARSEATWQSPGAIFVPAQQFDGCCQEIPTGLTALGMTVSSYLDGKNPQHLSALGIFGDPLEIRSIKERLGQALAGSAHPRCI